MDAQNTLKMPLKKRMLLGFCMSLMLAPEAFAGWDEAMAASQKGEYSKAYKELLPLAEQGNISAQTTLGVMYYNGQGVAEDHGAALVWLSLAASQGHDIAQFNLGVMYDSGVGTDQDFSEAARWYRYAANQRHVTAQYNLGEMYKSGEGVGKDLARAHMWFNISSTLGNDEATAELQQVEKMMTPSQIATARRLAGDCIDSGYQGC